MLVEERSPTSGVFPGRDQPSGDWLCLSTPSRARRSRKELYLLAKLAMFSESRPRLNRTYVCWLVKPVGEPAADRPHLNHRATSRLYPLFRDAPERAGFSCLTCERGLGAWSRTIRLK